MKDLVGRITANAVFFILLVLGIFSCSMPDCLGQWDTIRALSTVSQWTTMNNVYTAAAKSVFASVADSWIIAEALSQSVTVITYETPDPLCKKRVKIPDVCIAVGVKYCNLNDAFRSL